MIEADTLAELPFFSELRPETCALLAPLAERRRVKAGEVFFEERSPSRHLRVLVSGMVSLRLSQDDGDHHVSMGTFDTPGDVFGISALVGSKGYHPYGAICVEDCDVVEIDAAKLLDVCEREPAAGTSILRRLTMILGERLATAREQIRSRIRPGLISHG